MTSLDALLRLAVVGHTNTGKTSLLRTLTRNPDFGEVQNSPGTTRHVEGVQLHINNQPVVQLFDTPGIEDSIALLEYLQRLIEPNERIAGPDLLKRFLETPEATGRFEQEARVLRQLLASHAGLYVIDVRDPVLAKHHDELKILIQAGKPLLPVLNFTRSAQQRIDEWRLALANVGLHAISEFDTVAPALGGEEQLYERLALLVNQAHSTQLGRLIEDIRQQRKQRLYDAWRMLADMLVDVAAWRLVSQSDEKAMRESNERMQNLIREREEYCIKALLKRFNFSTRDYLPEALALDGTRWEADLFNPEVLKDLGIHVGKGVAAGAIAGATVDMLTLGFSLGTGTVIGAAAGGLWQGLDKWGQRLLGKWRGEVELSVDDAVIRVLALRQSALIQALDARGHAAQTPIALMRAFTRLESTENDEETPNDLPHLSGIDWRKGSMPAGILEARAHPDWSSLARTGTVVSGRRDMVVTTLAERLAQPASMQHSLTLTPVEPENHKSAAQ